MEAFEQSRPWRFQVSTWQQMGKSSIGAAQPGSAIDALQDASAVAHPMGTGFFGPPTGASSQKVRRTVLAEGEAFIDQGCVGRNLPFQR
jgi:hypothetical protein